MLSELLSIIKRAALDSFEQLSPVEVTTGRVMSKEPLRIKVSDSLILDQDRMILTKNVKDHFIEAIVEHTTDSASCGDGYHSHGYTGTKKYFVKNGLEVDDEVLLLRCGGGQRFIVLEKIGGEDDGA